MSSSLKPVPLYRVGLEAHVVEDEELGFRAEVDGVADAARRLQIGFGLLGDRARVAAIGLAGRGSRRRRR
jgi:hypothetical protein